MQALIDFIVRNIMALWPIEVVESWEIGLRVRLGIVREELAPGVHWRWWFIDNIITQPSTETVADLQTFSITTTDNKPATLSASLAYRVFSPKSLWLKVNDQDDSIHNLALGKLASICSGMSWKELKSDRQKTEKRLTKVLAKETEEWGVKITRVYLTDCVQAKQMRLFTEGSTLLIPE